ncbi:hypothetical protein EGP64_03820 [bacterium]|nr:hypothetical protein [bacterium]
MNKILITLIFPTIETSFDLYIPINKKIGTIKKYLLEKIDELNCFSFDSVRLLDQNSGEEYDNNILIKDSAIKNGTKIVIM